MLGQHKLSRRMRVRKVAAGLKGFAAALVLTCLPFVPGVPHDVASLVVFAVLVSVFIWFVLDGLSKRLAERIFDWRFKRPH